MIEILGLKIIIVALITFLVYLVKHRKGKVFFIWPYFVFIFFSAILELLLTIQAIFKITLFIIIVILGTGNLSLKTMLDKATLSIPLECIALRLQIGLLSPLTSPASSLPWILCLQAEN